MSLVKFKTTVKVPRSCIIVAAVVNAANEMGLSEMMLVTSGNDSKHKDGSKHFTDEALDFRTKHLDGNKKFRLADAVKKRLGEDYDVILEDVDGPNEHLHVEYDRK